MFHTLTRLKKQIAQATGALKPEFRAAPEDEAMRVTDRIIELSSRSVTFLHYFRHLHQVQYNHNNNVKYHYIFVQAN